jgi:hypothetical protein
MTTRRGFLKGAGAAGIAFCSCGLRRAAHAQEAGRRLPVMVQGRRIKTIDVHAHCLFRDALELMGDAARGVFGAVNGAENQYIAVAERLRQMDAMAIDMEVLSINPFWYRKDRDTSAAIVKLQNERLAELCAATRPLRRLCVPCAAIPRPCRRATRIRREEARTAWRPDRRQRRR